MVTTLGSSNLIYEMVEEWAKLPDGFAMGECASVAVDSKDRVYLFAKGVHPVVVLDRHGNFLTSWGEGIIQGVHGIAVGPDDFVFCTDTSHHVVRKFTLQGKLLLTMASESDRFGGKPFNRPTQVAISPVSGDLFVADGYANARIHRFSPNGKLMYSWGEVGHAKGQLLVPHSIVIDEDENVYVADRENHRVQVFNAKGKFQAMWPGIWRAAGLALGDDNVYVCEMPPPTYIADAPGVGHAVSIFDRGGKLKTRLGDPKPGFSPGQFTAPHGIAVDSHGDLYVCEMPDAILGAEWVETALNSSNARQSKGIRTITKLVRKR